MEYLPLLDNTLRVSVRVYQVSEVLKGKLTLLKEILRSRESSPFLSFVVKIVVDKDT